MPTPVLTEVIHSPLWHLGWALPIRAPIPGARGRGLLSPASEIQTNGDGRENRNDLVSATTAQGGLHRLCATKSTRADTDVAQAP